MEGERSRQMGPNRALLTFDQVEALPAEEVKNAQLQSVHIEENYVVYKLLFEC